MTDVLASLPVRVREALTRLRTELEQSAGSNLKGLILFGGVAQGRYVEGRSDVNLAVVLGDASFPALAAVAPALRKAFRTGGVEPLLLAEAEVAAAADVFPTKFLSIQAHHVVLAGKSPFTDLTVSREHVRLRVEQELRNLTLRLRRRLVAMYDEPATLAHALAEVVTPFAVELEALLKLAGKPAPADDSPPEVFAAAAQHLGLDGTTLSQLATFKGLPQLTAADVVPGVLAAMEKAQAIADGLPA